jgi:hypothetical protein
MPVTMHQRGCIRDWLFAETLLSPEVRYRFWSVTCLVSVNYTEHMELITEYIDG